MLILDTHHAIYQYCFAAGNADPVGEYGKAVKRIYRKYARWLDDVELKLYDNCRHELHSEINREQIFEDIYLWILKNKCIVIFEKIRLLQNRKFPSNQVLLK